MQTSSVIAKQLNEQYQTWGIKVADGWANIPAAALNGQPPQPGVVYETNKGPVQYQPAQKTHFSGAQKTKKGGYDVSGQIKGNAVTNAVQLAIATKDLSLNNILEQVRIVLQAHKTADEIYKEVMEGKQNAGGATQMTNSAAQPASVQTPAQQPQIATASQDYDDFDEDIPFL